MNDQASEAREVAAPVPRGVLPRPRTVILGDWTETELEQFRPLVGHLWSFPSVRELTEQVSELEIDLIVIKGAIATKTSLWSFTRSYFFIIYFPTEDAEEFDPHLGERIPSRFREFSVTPEGGELGQLARRATETLDSAFGLPRWKTVGTSVSRSKFIAGSEWLVRTNDQAEFAFLDVWKTGFTDVPAHGRLVVPAALCTTVSYWQWTQAAMRRWKEDSPGAFPNIRLWKEEPSWQTEREAELHCSLDRLESEKEELLREIEQRRATLDEELRIESIRADSKERRLLTAQGDELAAAVSEIFVFLGFDVVVPEEEATSAKAEDFILKKAAWKKWSASLEVKGFRSTGVKVIHAAKLGERRERRGTNQAILVVNSEFSREPSVRNSPFSNNQDARGKVTKYAVLILDTRQLFRVVNGGIPKSVFLKAVRDGSGVFEYDEAG